MNTALFMLQHLIASTQMCILYRLLEKGLSVGTKVGEGLLVK